MKPLFLKRAHYLKAILLFICCFSISSVYAQGHVGSIRGTVKTSDDKPAAFVNVYIKELKKSTTTDENGKFELPKVEAGTHTLTVSFVGLTTRNQEVVVVAGKTIHSDFVLEQNKGQLQEIMINGNKTNKYKTKPSEYAGKMPLSNLENSQVYSTISNELMQDQLIYSVDDAMRNATGITKMWEATSRAGDGGAYYNSRGFTVQSQLRNGIAGNVTGGIDAANLDHIEILKGPSATLFGSALTSYGGLINRVTKQPYDTFGGQADVSVGNYGYTRESIDINTPLDSAKKLLFRLNAAYSYKHSFQDEGFNRNYTVAPSLTYNPNKRLSITLDAELFYGQNQISPYYFIGSTTGLGTNNAKGLDIDYKKTYMGSGFDATSRNMNLFGTVKYKISDQWTSTTSVSSTNSFSNGFAPYYYILSNADGSKNPNAAPGSGYIGRYDQSTADSKDQNFEAQENINGDFKIGNLRNRVVVGLDYLRNNSNQHYVDSYYDTVPLNSSDAVLTGFNGASLAAARAAAPAGGINAVQEYPYIYKTNTYSAYASDVLNITDNFLALAAVRIDRFKSGGSYYPPSTIPAGAYNQTAYSPKFGLVYQPIKDVISIFANYQNGFTNVSGTDYQSKVFKPEQANQIEGGVKLNAFGGKLSGTISYYDIKVKDIVRTYINDEGVSTNLSIQNGTQTSKGVEAEITANPIAGLNMLIGFTYNDSKYENASADVNGLRPSTAGSPYTGNFWVSYKLPASSSVRGLGFGLGGNYANNNKIVNTTASDFILPAYFLLNASIFYDINKSIRVSFKSDNITNKEYYIGYGSVNPQQLRSFVGTLSYRFK